MATQEINQNFNKTIQIWKNVAEEYTDDHFALKPNEDSWAIGQVCQHLILSGKRVFGIIEQCLVSNANEHEVKTPAGEKAFLTNILSEEKVKVPIALQATPPQPENKQMVKAEFEEIENTFLQLVEKVNKSHNVGKEKHPVLGFMNSKEWLQTIEMHLRHHLKQKESIDVFLKSR